MPNLSPTAAVALSSLAAALAIALHGFLDRRRRRELSQVAERIENIENQILAFLEALDRRSHSVKAGHEDQLRSFKWSRRC